MRWKLCAPSALCTIVPGQTIVHVEIVEAWSAANVTPRWRSRKSLAHCAPPKHLSTHELPGRRISVGATGSKKDGRGLGRGDGTDRRAHGVRRLGAHRQRDGVEGVARQRDRDLISETPARGDVHLRELLAVPRDFRAVADENRDVVAVPESGVYNRLAQVSRRGYH